MHFIEACFCVSVCISSKFHLDSKIKKVRFSVRLLVCRAMQSNSVLYVFAESSVFLDDGSDNEYEITRVERWSPLSLTDLISLSGVNLLAHNHIVALHNLRGGDHIPGILSKKD